jgi:hypothetical protein
MGDCLAIFDQGLFAIIMVDIFCWHIFGGILNCFTMYHLPFQAIAKLLY